MNPKNIMRFMTNKGTVYIKCYYSGILGSKPQANEMLIKTLKLHN